MKKKLANGQEKNLLSLVQKKSTPKLFGKIKQFKIRNRIYENSPNWVFKDIAKSGRTSLKNSMQYTDIIRGASRAVEILNFAQMTKDSVETTRAFGWQAAFKRDIIPYGLTLGASVGAEFVGGPIAGGATAIGANTITELHKRKLDKEIFLDILMIYSIIGIPILVSISKKENNLNKIQLVNNYWVRKKELFDKNLKFCTSFENQLQKEYCYKVLDENYSLENNVKELEYFKNHIPSPDMYTNKQREYRLSL